MFSVCSKVQLTLYFTLYQPPLQFKHGELHCIFFFLFKGLFETLPGRVQCEMLLKATEQCFNTLERAEMLLLLLRRFPETVVQHGVSVAHNKHFVCLFCRCSEYSVLFEKKKRKNNTRTYTQCGGVL